MADKNHQCPKCGHPDVYVSAFSIECGYDQACENYSKTQAKEVQRLQDQKTVYSEMDDDFGWNDEDNSSTKYSLYFSD